MPKLIELEANKTYATKANAIKAVEKKMSAPCFENLRYVIIQDESGRFFPVFIGAKAIEAGAHWHFNVLG